MRVQTWSETATSPTRAQLHLRPVPTCGTGCRAANVGLVISILPHSHDLPGDDDTNQEISVVHAYIEELGTTFDFWTLMDLRKAGKRQLAGLIAESRQDAQAHLPDPNMP
ncbi:hypothetical protein J6590_049079 [Homalodisca vitripennis]|nr:hypothetical protein J6590_049079 [Homalodisca vitripennis]